MPFPRRHPYITAITIATLLAIVVWLCMPKEYAAITKLSDEYKEMDIAIGLDKKEALQRRATRDAINTMNLGINSMEVYCKVLKTEDFARTISHKHIPGKNVTYGEYLGKEDTIKAVLKHINYNYSNNHKTLSISFTDKDPLVASHMLDSVTMQLQDVVTKTRNKKATFRLQDAIKKREYANQEYRKAQKRYYLFLDTHHNISTQAFKQQETALQKEVELTYQNYKRAIETCVREQALQYRAFLSFAVIKDNTVPKDTDGSIWAYITSFISISLVFTFWVCQFKKDRSILKRLDFGNLFAPWNLTILLWTVVISCIYLLGDRLYPLTSQFYICISLWISIFCISSFVTYNLWAHSKDYTEIRQLHLNKTIFYLLLIVTLIFSPLCVKRVMDVISMFNTDNIMLAIRTVAIYGDGFGILDLCFVINKALLLVVLWRYPQVSAKTVFLILILLFLNSLAIMDKSTLFFIFVSFAFILYEKRKIRFIHIGICSVLVVALLFGLTVMRDSFVHKGSLDILLFLSEYIFANPVAFGYAHEAVSPQFGANTLFLLYYYLHRFDFGNYEVVDLVQEFSYVPIKTNLYTVMQPFYVDFGISGVAFFAILYGVGFGLCYRLYRNGNSSAKCIYTYLVYILLLQFGQEAIFLRPVEFLRLLLLVYLMVQRKFKLVLR